MHRSRPAPVTLLVVLSIGLLATSAAEKPPTSEKPPASLQTELRGTVLDPQGDPVVGATVRIRRMRTKADRNDSAANEDDAQSWHTTVIQTSEKGLFLASGLRGRLFALRVEAKGLAPANEPKVEPGSTVKISLHPGQELSGQVYDQQSGDPIAGAKIRMCDQHSLRFGWEACYLAETDDEGRFRSLSLAQDEHLLETVAPAHALLHTRAVAVPQALDPETDEPRTLELFLGPGARVAGEVRSGDDELVQNARVVLMPLSQGQREVTLPPQRTDEAGRFDFKGAPTGKHDLRVTAKGLPQLQPIPIEVETGHDQTDIVVRFSSGATMALRLVDPEDEPASGLELHVRATRIDGGLSNVGVEESQIETGVDGRYTIRGMPPGLYDLRFDVVGWRDLNRKNVTIREDETNDLGTFVLEEGGSISGSVMDDAGEPVADAHVQASWRDPDFRQIRKHIRSAEDGEYRLSGLNEEGLLELVEVQLPGYAPASKRSVVVGEEGVDFILQRTGGVQGNVQLPDGLPATVFRIESKTEAVDAEAQDPALMARRLMGVAENSKSFGDPKGRFTLQSLAPGRYTISATAVGVAAVDRAGVTVVGGEITDIGTLTLREGLQLEGQVVSIEDGRAVPGVILSVFVPSQISVGQPRRALATARSGSDGRFVIEGLEPGSFRLTTEHPDFSGAEEPIRLEDGVDPPLIVLRLGRGGNIRGTVRDEEGQPQVGAKLLLGQGSLMNQQGSVTVDADGSYSFEKLQPGDYVVALVVGTDVAGIVAKQAKVAANETSIVNFGEAPQIRLRGRLVRNGELLGGWLLMFRLPPETKMARTEADGSFQVGLEKAGNYQVALSPNRGGMPTPGKTIELMVPDEPEVYREIEVQGSSIRGQVLNTDNQPVPGAVVTAMAIGGSAIGASVPARTTAADGRYEIVGLEPGTYRLAAHATGFAPAERASVVVEEGADSHEDFTLDVGGRCRGRVVDPQGQGLAGAWVFAARAGAQEIDPMSGIVADANGGFEISTREGAVDLHVVAEGWMPGLAAGVETSADAEGREVLIAMQRGGDLSVLVLGPDEEPVAGAQLSLRPLDPSPGVILAFAFKPLPVTGLSGEWRFDSLAPGSYEVALAGISEVTPARVAVEAGVPASALLVVPASH